MSINQYPACPLKFALEEKLFPILDVVDPWKGTVESIPTEDNMAAQAGWWVTSENMKSLAMILEEEWIHSSPFTFYQLERRLRNNPLMTHMGRDSVIYACRYFFLHNMFDQNFWDRLCKRGEGPIEAELIVSTNPS